MKGRGTRGKLQHAKGGLWGKNNNSASDQGLLAAFLEQRPALARLVGRIVKRHDVDDIVQEHSSDSIKPLNIALNHVSRAENTLTLPMDDVFPADAYLRTPTLESQCESEERFLHFCEAVRTLPVQCRRAFIFKKVYGLSQKDIASFLGISESTVEKHISKGQSICAELMQARTALG